MAHLSGLAKIVFEVRFHGRGGQGVVVSAVIMAAAALADGKYAMAFPSFGAERRGAPVQSFLRITDSSTSVPRMHVYEPDCVVVMDPSLLRHQANQQSNPRSAVLRGLKPEGWIIVNTSRDVRELDIPRTLRVVSVNATAIAERHGLGVAAMRPVNTAILGALVRATGVVSVASLEKAIREEVPAKKDENIAAARDAYAAAKVLGE